MSGPCHLRHESHGLYPKRSALRGRFRQDGRDYAVTGMKGPMSSSGPSRESPTHTFTKCLAFSQVLETQ